MAQHLAQTALLVRDYDEAINFYVDIQGFELVEDTPQPDPHIPEVGKRWVVVSPKNSQARLLISKAINAQQRGCVGNQAGGRVFRYLFTADFWRDYKAYRSKGVEFIRGEPRREHTVQLLRFAILPVIYGILSSLRSDFFIVAERPEPVVRKVDLKK